MSTEPLSEDRELEALLALDLDGLESLGLDDPAFPSAVIPASPPVSLKPTAPQIAPVTNDPFSRLLDRPGDRTAIYKTTLLKEYQSAVEKIREVYDLICLGEMASMAPVRNLTGTLLELFRHDPPALLALSLTRSAAAGDYFYRHALNVCLLTLATATAAGHTKEWVFEAGIAALLADIGMRLVPDEILNKSGRLSEEELAEIQKHTGYSISLLASLEGCSQAVLQVAQQHHERLTGSGYPDHRNGDQIVIQARMVGIADTLAAMAHKRSHREALSPQEALGRVVKMGQMKFLDWELLKGLVGFISLYPVGSAVELSGGRIARVVGAHPEDPARPIVVVLRDAKGALALRSIQRLDLRQAREEKIVKSVDPETAGIKILDGF